MTLFGGVGDMEIDREGEILSMSKVLLYEKQKPDASRKREQNAHFWLAIKRDSMLNRHFTILPRFSKMFTY